MAEDIDDNDADLWLNLKSRLQQGQKDAQSPPIQWSYPLDASVGREPAASCWFADDIRHHEPVSQILNQWLQHGAVDDQSEQLRWFFAARFEPAIDLVARLTYSKGNLTPDAIWRTFFPFPRLPSDQVLRLLLDEWWRYLGCSLFFDTHFDMLLAQQRNR
jgi:hypothetical protein